MSTRQFPINEAMIIFESNLRKITTVIIFETKTQKNQMFTIDGEISNRITKVCIIHDDINIIHRVNNLTWSNKELNSA